MKYLLDTNICIYIIKKKPIPVLTHFESFDVGDIGMSSVTLAELKYGVAKSLHAQKNQLALDAFIMPLNLHNFDEAAANQYGNLRALLEKNGTPIGPLDLMIAAHALSLQVTLITNNVKEFSCVPKLSVENWAT